MQSFLVSPAAELRPLRVADDTTCSLTLLVFGQLRLVEKLGPWSMYLRLLSQWSDRKPRDIADKVMKFYRFYSINRHKVSNPV